MEELEPKPNSQQPEKTKHWLQRLKDESWEAELLISAVAIFGTFQLFKVIDWWTNKFIDLLAPNQHLIGYMIVFFGLFAVSILATMFVIHFFLRAYWVGLVGLNSVYPDYGLEDSAYSKIYTEKLISILPKLENSVSKVDVLCSVIFSAAFTLLLLYSYMAISASIYLFLYNLLSDFVPSYLLLIPVAVFAIILILQMVIGAIANIKRFKENRKLQLLTFKIMKLTSIISFGPFYKNILQVSMTFGSNYKKNKALIRLIILFLFTGIFICFYQLKKTNIPYLISNDAFFDHTEIYPGYYKNENENLGFLLAPEIKSDIISSNTFRVFIPVYSRERKNQKKVCGEPIEDPNNTKNENKNARLTHSLDCYQKYHHVFLNGERVDIDFMKYHHATTGQFGIIGYVDLSKGIEGKNNLEIKKVFGEGESTSWNIPFYYAPNSTK